MPKQVWIIAGVLTVAVTIGLLALALTLKQRELAAVSAQADEAVAQAERTAAQLEQTRTQLEEARAALARSEAGARQLQQQLNASQGRIAALQKEKDAVAQAQKSLEAEMRAALESKDITISQLQGRLTVNILDRILFDSGEADLKADGEAVLAKVAAVLAQHPSLKIHVVGHTDNVPIKAGARARFPTNWELSTARALAAVRFLTEKAGVDPRRLGAVGYGEFRPIADNATAEGRAKNRRIAITVLSEELAGSDAVPTAASSSDLRPPTAPPSESHVPAETK